MSEEAELWDTHRLQQLQAKKAYYQEFLLTNQSLPTIIEEKKQIVDNLKLSNLKLNHQTAFRSEELCELQRRLEEFERLESHVSKLQEKQRQMESQYEDYQLFNTKLDREIKVLHEESQILKGKAIIEYNKITEVREQASAQTRQKEVLEKHHEEMKKSGEILKKKAKILKEEQKKKSPNRHRIEEPDLERQINDLQSELDYANRQIDSLSKSRSYVTQDQYNSLIEQIKALEAHNQRYGQQRKLNEKLKSQKIELQERIQFLQHVDIQFINQKKMLLVELNQKYSLFNAQKQSQLEGLAKIEEHLAEYTVKYPEGLNQLKKMIKKKRQPKNKSTKKIKEVIEEPLEPQSEQKTYRFKGQKLKRIIYKLLVGLFIFALVFSQTMNYIIY